MAAQQRKFDEMEDSVSWRGQAVVFVVDDDISVRESLELLIQSAGWQPALCATGQEFMALPKPSVPNCLILDVNLPDLSGLDLQSLVATDRAETPIIFITGYGDIPTTVRAMKGGAVEFLSKPVNEAVLVDAVELALESSRISLTNAAEVGALRARHSTLTNREQQVMALVIEGLLNKQIAYELGITEITVKAHRGQVMRKMQARSLPELVNFGARLAIDRSARETLADNAAA